MSIPQIHSTKRPDESLRPLSILVAVQLKVDAMYSGWSTQEICRAEPCLRLGISGITFVALVRHSDHCNLAGFSI